MKTDNELIAEFMGWEKYGNAYKCPNIYPIENSTRAGWTTFAHETFEFDTRWDWLMPVVEKIESLNEVSFDIYREASKIKVYDQKGHGNMICKIYSPDANSKISHVYRAVIDFINWYNDNY